MREIRFRAKRLYDNKWVYGSYVKERGNAASIIDEETAIWHEVHPETVGQYADNGLCEGDLIRCGHTYKTYGVVWHDNGLIGRDISNHSNFIGLNHYYSDIKVIGNIHDNKPEVSK